MGINVKDEKEQKVIMKTDKVSYLSVQSTDDKYKYKEIHGKKYIIIEHEEDFITAWNSCSDTIACNDFNLVNSIINLKEAMPHSEFYKILDKGNIQDDTILYKLEEQLNDEHIAKIIEWCKEYGLPFLGEWNFVKSSKKDYKWFGFTNDMKTCFDSNILGFRIGTFLIGINIIYKTAYCADALRKIKTGRMTYNEIQTGIIKIKEINTDETSFDEIENVKDYDEKLEPYKQSLEYYIHKTTKAAQYHFQLGTKSNKIMYIPELYAETLLSASMYILFLWCCSPYKYTLKRCKTCNSFFITQKPNEKYCNNPCTRYTTSKANERLKNK